MVHLAYTAAGVNVKMIKVDYADKPEWYTKVEGEEEWNNKGQFPGAFVMCPNGKGKWVTDSGILLDLLKEEFPKATGQVSSYPEGIDASVLGGPNIFFKGESGQEAEWYSSNSAQNARLMHNPPRPRRSIRLDKGRRRRLQVSPEL
jgi:hypothetical protein